MYEYNPACENLKSQCILRLIAKRPGEATIEFSPSLQPVEDDGDKTCNSGNTSKAASY